MSKGASVRRRRVGRIRIDDPGFVEFGRDRQSQPLASPGASGDWVRYSWDEAGARVEEVLALAGSGRADLYRIAIGHGLEPTFPTAVEDEVERLLAAPGLDDPELVDLTDQAFCSIDDADTRDLDQALFIERTPAGWVVDYALADAAWYVRPGSALFAEALIRGSSFYLPGLVVPMLPRELSEGLISLNADVPRRALVFRMDLDRGGRCRGTEILRARIRSRAKLSFEEVQEFIDDRASNRFGDLALEASLDELRSVGEARMALAEARDVVPFRRREIDLELSDDGIAVEAVVDLRLPVERYNEQLSLLCNSEGGRLLAESDGGRVQAVFRIHPPPSRERIRRLSGVVRALVSAHGLDPNVWEWRRDRASLADWLAGLPVGGEHAAVATAIHRQALFVGGRSAFTARPGIHFGVGADVYSRFSAPMREVVGIYLHKEILERDSGHHDAEADVILRDEVIKSANESKETQKRITRAAHRLVLDHVFGAGRRFDRATVVGLDRAKLHLILDDPPIDCKIYVRHLERQLGEELRVDEQGIALVAGKSTVVRMGDVVAVEVRGRDEKDRWILAIRGPAR